MIRQILADILKTISKILPDKTAIAIQYWFYTGKKLDLSHPRDFTEEIQWLKLYDRRPEYKDYVDKYTVRKHIAQKIGQEHLIPMLGVYDRVEDIDWPSLPDRFVLKCTHGSGYNIVCPDKSKLNIETAKRKLKRWMKQDHFWYGREWVYKGLKPRIICEKYMVDETGVQLKDYKIYCFNGQPKFTLVMYDRFTSVKESWYDPQWNYVYVPDNIFVDPDVRIKKPEKLDEMLELARKLSQDFYHVRTDFYYINGKIYFGELTLYDCSGYRVHIPEKLFKLSGSE